MHDSSSSSSVLPMSLTSNPMLTRGCLVLLLTEFDKIAGAVEVIVSHTPNPAISPLTVHFSIDDNLGVFPRGWGIYLHDKFYEARGPQQP